MVFFLIFCTVVANARRLFILEQGLAAIFSSIIKNYVCAATTVEDIYSLNEGKIFGIYCKIMV
jgi:hypothetical protein